MKRTQPIPRGIRNNNPLNIRIGNTWLGELPQPTETEFEQFVTMKYGLRAAFIILRRYINRYQRNTIAQIVSSWAPSSENNTLKYIDYVSAQIGIRPDAEITYADKDTMCRLVAAMAQYECGQPIDYDTIAAAYDMA